MLDSRYVPEVSDQRIGEIPAGIDGVVDVVREIEAAVETIGMRTVRRPVALKVQAELEGVFAADQAEVIQEVETFVPLVIGKPRLGRNVGGVRDEIEERLRHDVIHIGGRKKLPQREVVGAALYRIEVVGYGAAEQIVRRASFLFTREADAEFVDHADGVKVWRPVDDRAVGQVLVMALEDRQVAAVSERAAAICPRIRIPGAGIHGDRDLSRGGCSPASTNPGASECRSCPATGSCSSRR